MARREKGTWRHSERDGAEKENPEARRRFGDRKIEARKNGPNNLFGAGLEGQRGRKTSREGQTTKKFFKNTQLVNTSLLQKC